jgi:hypothetical protein
LHQLQQAGLERVRTHFSVEQAARRLEQLWLAPPRPPGHPAAAG